MRKRPAMGDRLRTMLVAGLAAAAFGVPAMAHDHGGDQGLARDLFEQGEIHPLTDVLRYIHRTHPGDVVAVALVPLADKWVYRFQIVAPDGRRSVFDVDAGADGKFDDGSEP
jgi:uncharacterized membrane protein YkoI